MNCKVTGNFFVLCIAINFCFSSFANANADSTAKQSKFTLGISAGPNLTHVAVYLDRFNGGISPMVNYGAGGFFQYNFGKISSLRLEVLYARKSLLLASYNQYYFNAPAAKVKEYTTFHRLMLPVLYRATFNKFFTNAGFYLGYGMKETYGTKSSYGNRSTSRTPGKSYEKYFYSGFAGGIGFNFITKKSYCLSAELRDDLELTDKNSFSGNDYRLNTINLLFEIAFKL